MSKKQKFTPPVITSREAMESVVADVVRLKLERAGKQAVMEAEMAAVTQRHEEGILELDKQIELKEAGLYIYCTQNRSTLFEKAKSIRTLLAEVGFEFTPHAVEKKSSKDTWGAIAKRLLGLAWGKEYVREADPEVDKNKLRADRDKLTKDQLDVAGLRIIQEEQFFIRPHSEIAEQTTKVA